MFRHEQKAAGVGHAALQRENIGKVKTPHTQNPRMGHPGTSHPPGQGVTFRSEK